MKQELDSLSVVKYVERFHCGSHRGQTGGAWCGKASGRSGQSAAISRPAREGDYVVGLPCYRDD